PTGRLAGDRGLRLSQHYDRDARERTLARGRFELSRMGRVARRAARDSSAVVQTPRPEVGNCRIARHSLGLLAPDVYQRESRLGVLRHGPGERLLLLPSTVPRLRSRTHMRRVLWLKKALEFLGGERDEPPGGGRRWLSSPLWGLWWA